MTPSIVVDREFPPYECDKCGAHRLYFFPDGTGESDTVQIWFVARPRGELCEVLFKLGRGGEGIDAQTLDRAGTASCELVSLIR
jgi:hypothetical protein